MADPRVKALFFDLDGTLYDCAPIYADGLRRAWHGFRATADVPFDAFQAAYERARAAVHAALPGSPAVHNRLLYFKRLVEAHFGRLDAALALRLDRAYRAAYGDIDFAPVRPALEALARRFPLGLLTNQVCESQLEKVARLDPSGTLFRVVVTSEEAGAEKPAAAIFEAALQRMGCAPGEAALAGDDWQGDVMGALRAGWQAVYVSRLPPAEPHPGVLWVRSVAELAERWA